MGEGSGHAGPVIGDGDVVEAWVLPPGLEPPAWDLVPLRSAGYRVPRMDAAFATALVDRLKATGEALAQRSPAELAATLGRVGRRFSDPRDDLRTAALRLLPETGVSAGMAEAVLDGMAVDWTEARLRGLVEAEFGRLEGVGTIPENAPAASSRIVHRIPPRLCVQIVAGSVPGVTVNAMLRSLLVGAPTLVKPGRGDVVLPVLFGRALAEEDPTLSEALAVLYWVGGSSEAEDAILDHAEVVVVYGGDETLRSVRARVPATTRVVGYHHRVSVAVVGRDALPASETLVRTLAEAAAMFDQRGCVCPQLVFVEGTTDAAEEFARVLARACFEVEERLPPAALDLEEEATRRQWRASAELWEATGGGRVFDAGSGSTSTVVYEPVAGAARGASTDSGPRPAPPGPTEGRTIRVRPVEDVSLVPRLVAPVASHLQTVGYAGLSGRVDELADRLSRTGASRVVPIREMAFPPAWWLHDGRGPLRELVRWMEVEREPV